MATPWPQVAAWPNDPREHAAYLSDYLRKALVCIDSAEDQSVPKPLVKTMIAAISVLITKFQNTPDLSAVVQAIISRATLKQQQKRYNPRQTKFSRIQLHIVEGK
jgi:hypothetical protein